MTSINKPATNMYLVSICLEIQFQLPALDK